MTQIIDQLTPPISAAQKALLCTALEGARGNFERSGHVCAMALFANGHEIIARPIQLTPDNKDEVFAALQAAGRRLEHGAVFISECWAARPDPDNWQSCVASEAPNRYEVVNVQLYSRDRGIIFSATITHEPDALGEWELWNDTANAATGQCFGRGVVSLEAN